MNPTKEQIQWLWEQCRARCIKCNKLIKVKSQRINSDCCCYSYELDLDLNNLFKYAVPKIKTTFWRAEMLINWIFRIVYYNEDPALSLFWAIKKALGGRVSSSAS